MLIDSEKLINKLRKYPDFTENYLIVIHQECESISEVDHQQLRQQLICAALSGLLADPQVMISSSTARSAIEQADAVLKELEKE